MKEKTHVKAFNLKANMFQWFKSKPKLQLLHNYIVTFCMRHGGKNCEVWNNLYYKFKGITFDIYVMLVCMASYMIADYGHANHVFRVNLCSYG
jgi:hypothetical protein